ncbi:MAG: FAD-dependent oxidoreductase [Betaproteobacteria bacterium]|nr:FAD-dependent oxidoreductase [Betaproteobacteria bacterium]
MVFDVVVVGSGIVGLACAWAALQRGDRVLVLERDDRCVGASIRNFGFVTVTGQGRGLTWERARATREVWAEIAPQAGIELLQEGLLVLAQREEAVAVLQSLGQLQAWLQRQGVVFQNGAAAHLSHDARLSAAGASIPYGHLVLAPGPDLRYFAPQLVQEQQVNICRLSMMRVQVPAGYVLPHPVMSDLSLVRYRGYAEQACSASLLARLQAEQPDHLTHGIHLIVVQSADGSLVVGDSHHYGSTIEPFAQADSETLILKEMKTVLQLPEYRVTERWVGQYPSGKQDAVIERIAADISLVSVTSGTGMSTGFALAQEWAEMTR